MKKPSSVLSRFLLIALASHFVVGCSKVSEADLPRIATEFRDNWIEKEKPGNAEYLRTGIFKSVEPTENGWRVTFVTETGINLAGHVRQYNLHVLFDRRGRVIGIVQGPNTYP